MKKHVQKRSGNMIRFCHFQSWGMQIIAMDFIWWVSAKCRNCFWPWGFLNRWLVSSLTMKSIHVTPSWRTLMCILNCLLHINFDSRSLLHCYDAMICGLTWVYPVSTSYSICKPVHYSYGCDMPASWWQWVKQSLHIRSVKRLLYTVHLLESVLHSSYSSSLFSYYLCTLDLCHVKQA